MIPYDMSLDIAVDTLANVENFDALAEEHWADFNNKKPVFKKSSLSRFSAIVARDNGVPVGYILFLLADSPFYDEKWCHIGMYYLRRPYRGLGAGVRMFQLLEDTAKEKDCVCIQSSFNVKQPLDDFYQKLGFTTTHHGVAKEI